MGEVIIVYNNDRKSCKTNRHSTLLVVAGSLDGCPIPFSPYPSLCRMLERPSILEYLVWLAARGLSAGDVAVM